MAKELLINVSEGEECRIALVEDAKLEELYMERSSSTSHVNNIYKGRVTNVEPSIQAAFIDFGLGRNGFLHISDLMPTYFGRRGEDVTESVGRKMSRRDRPPIQRCLRRGDEIVVQVIKEGIGTKGPTLSSYLSISGKILVMMPGMSGKGVSRKIEDEDERRRLRLILDALKPPPEVGFIIRTAGVEKTKAEIQRDFTYLTRLWSTIEKKRDSGPGPMELFTEGDLVTRTVRDVFTSDIERIIIDNKEVAKRVKEVVKLSSPRTRNKVELYEEPIPLFHKYNIEHDIEMMYSRHVPLPSGGSLVIDSTEAVVAIDVNSGKFRDHSDAETTAFKTDMEAADEIPRQLRLRDLGGVIICDFIDLRYERHRRELEHKLHENFKKDRAKNKVLRMSQFGIIEMTRQRMRPSLKRSIYYDCPHCKGSGLVKTSESMSLDVMRRLAIAVHDARVQRVELNVSPEVEFYLQNRKRVQIAHLEQSAGKRILIRGEAKMGLDEIRLDLFDLRESPVHLPHLGIGAENGQAAPPPGRGRDGRQRGDRDRDQRGQRPDSRRDQPQGARPGQPGLADTVPPGEEETIEDSFDLDGADDAVDEREREEERIARGGPVADYGSSGAPTDRNPPPRRGPQPRPPQNAPRGPQQNFAPGRLPGNPQGQGNRQGQNLGGSQLPRQEEDGEGPRRRRRRRGGRGRRRRQGQWGDGQEQFAQHGNNAQRPASDDEYAGADAGSDASSDASHEPFAESSSENDEGTRPEDSYAGGEFDERDSARDERFAERSEIDTDRDKDERVEGDLEEAAHDGPESASETEEPAKISEAPAKTPADEGEQPARGARRRRGGRGRRGKRGGKSAAAPPESAEAPADEPSASDETPASFGDAGEPAGAPAEKPRRGRQRGRAKRVPPASGSAPAGNAAAASVSQDPIPTGRAPRGTPADRHHLNDEPVIQEPPRRARSYRDLDAIPDDYD